MSDSINMLAAALAYARLGIAVFPVWQALPFKNGGYICAWASSRATTRQSIRLGPWCRTD